MRDFPYTFESFLSYDLDELFLLAAKGVEVATFYLGQFLEALCAADEALLDIAADRVIHTESMVDTIREAIVKELASEVLEFSREDRYYIIFEVEEVVDAVEDIVLRLRHYIPQNHPSGIDGMVCEIGAICRKLGFLLKETIRYVFDNFEGADILANKIRREREEYRDLQSRFLREIYTTISHPTDLLYFDHLADKTAFLVNKINGFGSGLQGFVYKYDRV